MGYLDVEFNYENQVAIGAKATPTFRINLSSAEEVRREMSRVYREARNKKLPINEATKLTYILTQILRATEMHLLEERLMALELNHFGVAK